MLPQLTLPGPHTNFSWCGKFSLGQQVHVGRALDGQTALGSQNIGHPGSSKGCAAGIYDSCDHIIREHSKYSLTSCCFHTT